MTKKIVLPTPYRGIITPMVTPLLNDETIDITGLTCLIEHLVEGGVHGIFLLGTTGEGPSLSYKMKHELIERTCQIANNRVPVLVCISDSSPSESIALAKFSEKNNVAAVVAAPPFYFGINKQELIQYYQKLADKLPLPLFIYNIPSQTKVMVDVSTVQTLSSHPNIIGIKDSSGNAPHFNMLLSQLQAYESFSVFVGPDEMLSTTVLMGGHGGVNSGSNLYPKLFVDLYNAAVNGDLKRVLELHQKVMLLSFNIYQLGDTGASFLKGLKLAMSTEGICSDFMLSPLIPLENSKKSTVKSYIESSVMEIPFENNCNN